MSFASHLMLRLRVDRVVARSPGGRRGLADTVLRASAPFPLLCFRAADTHIHLLLGCDERSARECGRRIEIGLTQRLQLAPGFSPGYARPVVDQRHLRNAFAYILRQEARHGIGRDPLHDASSLPDLLGLRVVAPELRGRVGEWLPRVAIDELWSLLPGSVEPASVDVLAEAGAAALALPGLRGRRRGVVEGRAAAAQVAVGYGVERLASALSVTPRTVRRLWSLRVDPVLLRAVEMQARLRTGALAVGEQARLGTGVLAVGDGAE